MRRGLMKTTAGFNIIIFLFINWVLLEETYNYTIRPFKDWTITAFIVILASLLSTIIISIFIIKELMNSRSSKVEDRNSTFKNIIDSQDIFSKEIIKLESVFQPLAFWTFLSGATQIAVSIYITSLVPWRHINSNTDIRYLILVLLIPLLIFSSGALSIFFSQKR